MLRLFIAIEFPREILHQFRQIQADLRRLTIGGRFPPADNLHLTLQFLGDTPQEQVPRLIASLAAAAGQSLPFALTLGEPGVFGETNPYRVVWLGVKGELTALRQLRAAVARATASLGFAGERAMYRPHITLARAVNFSVRDRQGPPWRRQASGPSFMVRDFALLDSSLCDGKRTYRRLAGFALAGDMCGQKKENRRSDGNIANKNSRAGAEQER